MSKADSRNIEDRAEAIMTEIDRAFAEILDAAEQCSQAANQLGNQTQNAETAAMIDKIQVANARIVAACSSQDVIRQHLDLLVKGRSNPPSQAEQITDGEKLLAGPQIDGQGLNQQDIDDIFD